MKIKRLAVQTAAWLLVCMVFFAATSPAFVYAIVSQRGDTDGNRLVDMTDAIRLYQHQAGLCWLFSAYLDNADVNGDEMVDAEDMLLLYRVASGDSFLADLAPIPENNVSYGIDVSYAQGDVDWEKVKLSGVDFVVLRCGYGQDDPEQDDDLWEQNAAACEEYGIPYGTYFFCYARTAEEALGEAQHALRLLEGKNLSLPVFYDMEYSNWQGNLTNEEYAEIAKTFCGALQEAGFEVGVYANLDWWTNRLIDPCFDEWYRWVAQYYDQCDYEGEYHLWQFSDGGTVSGIEGSVDENFAYIDFGLLSEAIPDGSLDEPDMPEDEPET